MVFYKFQNNFKFSQTFKETEKLLFKSIIENYCSWDFGFTVNYVGTCTMQGHKVKCEAYHILKQLLIELHF